MYLRYAFLGIIIYNSAGKMIFCTTVCISINEQSFCANVWNIDVVIMIKLYKIYVKHLVKNVEPPKCLLIFINMYSDFNTCKCNVKLL